MISLPKHSDPFRHPQGKYAEAEPLNQLAQAIEKRDFGQMLASKVRVEEALVVCFAFFVD